jgi:hypothetical protein
MKYFIALCLIAFNVAADQRFETTGGFCHFVLGLDANGFIAEDSGLPIDDDNETFFANCENAITVINEVGQGSTRITVKYANKADVPLKHSLRLNGADTGVDCVMVDSNNNVYVTRDWNSSYKVQGDNGNGNGNSGKVLYKLSCRNGAQQ